MLAVALDAIAVLAALLWSGGLLALGAIVAPTVFGAGDPHAADVMTRVFLRFDRVAVVCAALVLACEALRATLGASPGRASGARTGLAVLLAACAGIQAAYLTPTIVSLYEHGILRGTPRFDRVHRASEWLGKLIVVSAIAYAATIVATRPRTRNDASS